METTNLLLVCTLDDQLCAFRFALVRRVLRAATCTPLPTAPDDILGVVNLSGQCVPVLNLRQCFGLPTRALEPSDRFVLTHTARLPLIFVVDSIVEVRDYEPGQRAPLRQFLPRTKKSVGIECFTDGLIVINSVNSFLLATEAQKLNTLLPTSLEAR
jgi:purine-binding chemotaxis protein CheW